MNINDLTIGQAKELAELFGNKNNPVPPQYIASSIIGKYVIARCYAAGVHAGEVVSVDGENVVLKDSRRLWNWKAVDGVALSGLAQNGLAKNSGSKIDTKNPEIYLTGVCELIPCAKGVKETIDV